MPTLKLPPSSLIYAAIIILAAIALLAIVYNGQLAQKDIAPFLLALFGTFLGATFAFRLNEDKEMRKLEASKRTALNRAVFVLCRQHTAIRQLLKEIQAYKSPYERAFNFPALQPPPYTDLVQNFSDLEFLLESTEPTMLLHLTVEQERFHQAIESLRLRNVFYVNEFQPEIARLSLNGKVTTPEKVEALLDERIFGTAMNGAANVYAHLEDCDKSIPAIYEQLRKLAGVMYPSHKFIQYELPA